MTAEAPKPKRKGKALECCPVCSDGRKPPVVVAQGACCCFHCKLPAFGAPVRAQ